MTWEDMRELLRDAGKSGKLDGFFSPQRFEAVENDTLLYRWVRGGKGDIDPNNVGLDLSFRQYLLPLRRE